MTSGGAMRGEEQQREEGGGAKERVHNGGTIRQRRTHDLATTPSVAGSHVVGDLNLTLVREWGPLHTMNFDGPPERQIPLHNSHMVAPEYD